MSHISPLGPSPAGHPDCPDTDIPACPGEYGPGPAHNAMKKTPSVKNGVRLDVIGVI